MDVWEPLLAIADLAGGDWPDRARAAALALSAGVKVEDTSLGVILLKDIRSILDSNGQDRIHTADLLTALNAMDESPWGDLSSGGSMGKGLNSRRLAKELKPYGIKPKDVRDDGKVQKGYYRDDFMDSWSRYLPADATSATSATEVEPEPAGVALVAHVADTSGGAEEKERWKL